MGTAHATNQIAWQKSMQSWPRQIYFSQGGVECLLQSFKNRLVYKTTSDAADSFVSGTETWQAYNLPLTDTTQGVWPDTKEEKGHLITQPRCIQCPATIMWNDHTRHIPDTHYMERLGLIPNVLWDITRFFFFLWKTRSVAISNHPTMAINIYYTRAGCPCLWAKTITSRDARGRWNFTAKH